MKDADGHVEGCHTSEAEADRQLAAKYAQEGNVTQTDAFAKAVQPDENGDCPEGYNKMPNGVCLPAATVADTDAHGGKPDPGTKKDKRLKENQAGGETVTWAVDETPWDAAAALSACADADSPARCYNAVCAGRKSGDPALQSSWALPHHKTAGGPPNAAGVRNALSRIGQTSGLTNAGAARGHLETHMTAIRGAAAAAGLDVREFIARCEAVTAAGPPARPAGGKTPADEKTPASCPPGQHAGPDGRCVPDEAAAEDVATFQPTEEDVPVADPGVVVDLGDGLWRGVLAVEGRVTGDGREFAPDSLRWENMPLPLTYQPPSHGGQSTDGFVVGRIERVWRDGQLIRGEGHFDLDNPDAAEIARQVGARFLRGVSVDVDSVADADVEFVWPEEVDVAAEESEAGDLVRLFANPERMIYHSARIRAAAVVPIPAFIEAEVWLAGGGDGDGVGHAELAGAVAVHAAATSDGAYGPDHEARLPVRMPAALARGAYAYVGPGAEVAREDCQVLHHEVSDDSVPGPANLTACAAGIGRGVAGVAERDRRGVYLHLAAHLRAAGREPPPYDDVVTASAEPGWRPPREWFEDPRLSVPTPVTVDDAGRVYGHAAMWGECHIGHADLCVTPPHEDDHPYFMTGEVLCADGERVAVGQVTVGTGHAPLHLAASRAAEHYDDTGCAVADVTVGNDVHGIWVAGAVRPDVEEGRVRTLRAAGQVSGDWRRIGGQLRLVGLLAVNVPGFPVPRTRARVASGTALSLVAAGRLTVGPPEVADAAATDRALRAAADLLAARVGRPRAGLTRDALAERVHAGRR